MFPVRTLQAARLATREYFAQLATLLDGLTARLSNGRTSTALTTAIRGLDHASQQLLTTARPLSRSPFRRDELQHNLLLCTQASFHARNLAAGVERGVDLAPATRAAALAALGTQRELVSVLAGHFGHLASSNGRGTGTSRLTDALRQAGDVIPVTAGHDGFGTDERVLLRHIVRLDETLAELGDNLSRRHAS